MITILAVITAKPGMRDTILMHFRANVPAVHAENGCIEYGAAIDAANAPPLQKEGEHVVPLKTVARLLRNVESETLKLTRETLPA